MDDDEQENLPTFRHFTRDDLAAIQHLIFENKLAEKKKAEKLAKNKAVRTIYIYVIHKSNGKPTQFTNKRYVNQ